MNPTRYVGWIALFALGMALPFLVRNDYSLTVMSTAYIFALATVGLNLLTGYTGQFNLAHGGFMAIGAYTVGILTVDYQVPFWIAFALAGVVSVVLGFFVGLVSLRLKGNYFAIFTLCVGYIIFLVIEKWDSLTHDRHCGAARYRTGLVRKSARTLLPHVRVSRRWHVAHASHREFARGPHVRGDPQQ
jgi:branched-chain amino acid transport system permease protein